jgi:hypothetical protein
MVEEVVALNVKKWFKITVNMFSLEKSRVPRVS